VHRTALSCAAAALPFRLPMAELAGRAENEGLSAFGQCAARLVTAPAAESFPEGAFRHLVGMARRDVLGLLSHRRVPSCAVTSASFSLGVFEPMSEWQACGSPFGSCHMLAQSVNMNL